MDDVMEGLNGDVTPSRLQSTLKRAKRRRHAVIGQESDLPCWELTLIHVNSKNNAFTLDSNNALVRGVLPIGCVRPHLPSDDGCPPELSGTAPGGASIRPVLRVREGTGTLTSSTAVYQPRFGSWSWIVWRQCGVVSSG